MRAIKNFTRKFQKAFFCTLIFANCNYWLYESMSVIQFVDEGKESEAIQTDRSTFIVSYLFPNTLIFLPMLGGILIDYIGPITALRYLTVILLMGSLILIKAVYTMSVWMVVLSALFFGFTLEIINMATYIYIANTFITKEYSIEFFKVGIAIYMIFGIPLSSLAYLVKNTYITTYIGIGLIVLSFIFTGMLRIKGRFLTMNAPDSGTLRFSFDSLEYDPRRSTFMEKTQDDNETFVEHNEKWEIYEVKGLWKYLREIPRNRLLGIIAMGIWEGIYFFFYRIIGFGGSYLGEGYFWFESLGYIVGSIFTFSFRWDVIKLNKFILGGMIVNAILMITAGLTPRSVDMVLIILMTLTNSITNGAVLLALPFYMNFNVESFGKGYGFFRWCCCFAQFITSNFKTNDLAFSNKPFVLGFFLPTILCLMLFAVSLLIGKGKFDRKSKVNFASSIEI